MSKIIKITADSAISMHDFPNGGYAEQIIALQEMVGNGCDLVEHVRPRRLYEEMGAPVMETSMLVDEEGRLKGLPVNIIASWLYMSDIHGNPIVGDVLIIGEEKDFSGEIDFCGLSEEQFNKLYPQFKRMAELAGDVAE